MPGTATKTHITQVGRVVVPVSDTDQAIAFYVDTVGLEKRVDVPMGEGYRWVEVGIPGAPTTVAIVPPPTGQPVGKKETGVVLDTTDIDADHAALKARGVDVDDEITRYGGPVPPMFWFRDPDGNSLLIVEPQE